MTYIVKPKIVHGGLQRNALGLTIRDYEGSMSTLCAGCGHDSITAAIVQAFFELDVPGCQDERDRLFVENPCVFFKFCARF